MIINIIATNQAFSQGFTGTSLSETAVGVATVNPRCTGNDIWDIGSDTYRVSVWDDNSTGPGIAWDVDYSATSYSDNTTLFYTSNVIDPDVALLSDGTDLFAIVVYHVGGATPRFVYETFLWDNPGSLWGFYSMGTPVSLATGSHYTAINVDASDNDEFVIAWDVSAPQIYMVTGKVTSGSFSLYNGSSPVTAVAGTNPDVCLFYDGTDNVVHFTYLTSSNSRLYVQQLDMSDLANGTYSTTQELFTGPVNGGSFIFMSPRIACPNSSGAATEWTVVVEENDGTDFFINGYNDCCGTTAYVYNDGSINPLSYIYEVPNHLPVVTYDDDSPPNIWIGWTFDNSTNLYTSYTNVVQDAMYPIVLKCDDDAAVIGSTYWQVPNGIVTTAGDRVDILSVSGRYATCKFYLTYNSIVYNGSAVDDIYNKEAACSTSSLRSGNYSVISSEINELLKLSNETSNEIFLFVVYDSCGRELLFHQSSLNEMRSVIKSSNIFVKGQLYLLVGQSTDGNILHREKINLN